MHSKQPPGEVKAFLFSCTNGEFITYVRVNWLAFIPCQNFVLKSLSIFVFPNFEVEKGVYVSCVKC